VPTTRLALLLLTACAAVAAQTAGSSVTEPRTGISFPTQLVPPGSSAPHQLTGTAVRERTIFNIKVYALGLYVDAAGAKGALAPFVGVPTSTLARDARFFRRLLEQHVAMTLRLVMARDVEGEAIADAFDGALRPRVAQAATRNLPGGAAALDRFRGYFDLRQVARGTEIVFSCDPAGRLSTQVGGAPRPAIESRALCWALFDVYLGEKPISGDARRNLVAGFPELLSDGR
jgi:hypothetical protein